MRTIHFPEKIIPAYDVEVFEYGELSDEAKDRALDNFIDSGEPRFQLDRTLDDIFDALKGCDYEDSPIAQFERDVWCRYLELKEEE